MTSQSALAQLAALPLAEALETEQRLAAAMGGDVGAISALRVLQLYLERLGCTLVVSARRSSSPRAGVAGHVF